MVKICLIGKKIWPCQIASRKVHPCSGMLDSTSFRGKISQISVSIVRISHKLLVSGSEGGKWLLLYKFHPSYGQQAAISKRSYLGTHLPEFGHLSTNLFPFYQLKKVGMRHLDQTTYNTHF
jgi:hypothetical protein